MDEPKTPLEVAVVVSGPCLCGQPMSERHPGVLIRRPADFAAAPLCASCVHLAWSALAAYWTEPSTEPSPKA